MCNRSKVFYILVIVSFAVMLIPVAAAFRLDVNCPDTVDAGNPVTCTIDLSEDVTEVFGDQFVINALGFTEGTPFLEPDTNGVSSHNSGGLGATTILLKFSEGQLAGPVATLNLIAGAAAGAYTISLTNYVTANSATPDTIIIVASTSAPLASDGSSGGSSGGGGGSSSGSDENSGSSGSKNFSSRRSGTSRTDITEEEPLEPVEESAEESLPSDVVKEELSSAGTASSKKYLWLLLSGMGALIVGVISILIIYLRKRTA